MTPRKTIAWRVRLGQRVAYGCPRRLVADLKRQTIRR